MLDSLIAGLAIAPTVQTAFNGMGGLNPFPEKNANLAELATLNPAAPSQVNGSSVRFQKIISGSPNLSSNSASSVAGLGEGTGRVAGALKANSAISNPNSPTNVGSRTSIVSQSVATSQETSKTTSVQPNDPLNANSPTATFTESSVAISKDVAIAAQESRLEARDKAPDTRSTQAFRVYEAAQKLERDIAITHEKMFNIIKMSV